MHFVKVKGILSQNNGMNVYRGCSHGCIYCDSRSRCYGFTHAFEDEENIRGLMDYCIQAEVKGIIFWDIGMTLREGDREYYYRALNQHFPGMKRRYIQTYGNAYQLPSPRNKELSALVRNECKKHGIMYTPEECFAYLNELPEKYTQLSLF